MSSPGSTTLLDTAEKVGASVEAPSQLAWMVLRNPLVRLASASVASDRVARESFVCRVNAPQTDVVSRWPCQPSC